MGAECGVECECEKEESTGQMYLTSLPMNTEEKAAEERRLVVQASTPVELHFTSPCEFTLHAYEANTVLEVLETRAEQIGLPKTAAAFLEMKFPTMLDVFCPTLEAPTLMCSALEAIMENPHKTLEEVLDESGLRSYIRSQAKISVHGEDEAGAKLDSWIVEHPLALWPIGHFISFSLPIGPFTQLSTSPSRHHDDGST